MSFSSLLFLTIKNYLLYNIKGKPVKMPSMGLYAMYGMREKWRNVDS